MTNQLPTVILGTGFVYVITYVHTYVRTYSIILIEHLKKLAEDTSLSEHIHKCT